MYRRVDICFSLAVSARQRERLRLPSSPPIPPMTLFQPCGFSLNFLAQNKVLYEGGLFLLLPGLAWSQAEQKNLTNRSALARLPAKLRGLAMLVETQVLSTLPPGSPNLHPPYLSPQPLPPALLPFPSDLTIRFESTSVTRSSQALWIQVLLKQSSREQRELEFRVKMLKWDCSPWQ